LFVISGGRRWRRCGLLALSVVGFVSLRNHRGILLVMKLPRAKNAARWFVGSGLPPAAADEAPARPRPARGRNRSATVSKLGTGADTGDAAQYLGMTEETLLRVYRHHRPDHSAFHRVSIEWWRTVRCIRWNDEPSQHIQRTRWYKYKWIRQYRWS
jgi:hypothetical protein